MTPNPHYMLHPGCTHTASIDTQKPSGLSPLSLSLLHGRAEKAMNHMKDVAAPEMFPWASLEKSGLLSQNYRAQNHPPFVFSTPPPGSALTILNAVLDAPLPHRNSAGSLEAEAPGLLPSLPVAENDSCQDGKQRLEGGPREGGVS